MSDRQTADPLRILGRARIHDLWGAGYTVVPRFADPFDVPLHIVPPKMAYQWNAKKVLGEDIANLPKTKIPDGWSPVPAERHPGIFAPFGYEGEIEVGGQVLMEKSKALVDEAKAASVRKAEKQIEDWTERFGGAGISGGFRVWTGDERAPPPSFKSVGDAVIAEKVIESTQPLLSVNNGGAAPIIKQRIPRHPALRWLFNLISKEQ